MTNYPNLFIVGAPKCGTTAWVQYLSSHKDIFFSEQKEPHYFSTDFSNYCWAKTLEEYLSLFKDAGQAKIVGEASVHYINSKVAAQNIFNFNPDAKILIFLRKHRDFLPSYHNQLLLNLDETITDFGEVWKLSKEKTLRNIPATCREPVFLDYVRVGMFSEQIDRFYKHFAPDNIKIMWFDNWVTNPRQAYQDIVAFLGIEDDGFDNFEKVHGAKSHRNKIFAKFTQRPPLYVLKLAAFMRRVLGLKRLGAAKHLRRLNQKEGYQNPVPEALKQDIDKYFADEIIALSRYEGLTHITNRKGDNNVKA